MVPGFDILSYVSTSAGPRFAVRRGFLFHQETVYMNDFAETCKGYTLPEAIREAQRCLHCKVPSCKKGCPISNDIPDWIAELAKGNFGNTAIDAARTALRMGSREVTVVYHRSIEQMKALRSEYDDAVAEGVKFLWNTSITDIEALDQEHLKQITLRTDGEESIVPADHVIMAVGSAPASRIVSSTKGIDVDDKGYVLTRENPYGMTSRKGVFAGGDVTNRQATVVHAMHDAKQVAEGIARYIDAVKLMESINNA